MGKPDFKDWPRIRRSQRNLRKLTETSQKPLKPQRSCDEEYIWKTLTENKLSRWLDREFPATPCRPFYTYYDEYVQKESRRLEKHCFGCKEPVKLRDAYICGHKKCDKVYHRQCVADPVNHLCSLHFCAECNDYIKDGLICHMCPRSTCADCLGKAFGKKQMSLCCTCAALCQSNNLDSVVGTCLYCTPLKVN